MQDEAEGFFDEGTVRHLSAIGVGPGWECLEVAGGPAITSWLCERAGPAGRVVVADGHLERLQGLTYPNLTLVPCDPVTDDLGRRRYDLVHSRLLFARHRSPRVLLEKMIEAVRPSGWVLVEDVDFSAFTSLPAERIPVIPPARGVLVKKFATAFDQLLSMAGRDLAFGRLVPETLIDVGLVDVQAQTFSCLVQGGSPGSLYARSMIERFGSFAVQAGLLDAEDLELAAKLLEDPDCYWMQPPLVSAWGRRP